MVVAIAVAAINKTDGNTVNKGFFIVFDRVLT